ncbi:MAG: PfkB family carbohydrate kinase [Clostridia bacterium]
MTKHYDTLVIGHTSQDYNIDYQNNLIKEIGGAVFYSSASAYASGYKVGIITTLNEKDKERLQGFLINPNDVYCTFGNKSTSIRNQYFTADKEKRKCTCISQGDQITIANIPDDIESNIYHLAGLIYGDFSEDLIEKLAKKGKVAVDVQGYLRHANGDNSEMYFEDWLDKKKLLPYITYFKTDAAEAEILTGNSDRYEAIKILYSWGAKEVVITHNTEVIAYDGTTLASCPIRARSLVGRSGRGDTTFASYITERQNASVKDALLWATATVSSKMENAGAYKGNRKDIQNYIDTFYSDIK